MKSTVTIDVQILHKTASAVLVSDGDTEAWFPIVVVDDWDDEWGAGDYVSMDVPDDMAHARGLV